MAGWLAPIWTEMRDAGSPLLFTGEHSEYPLYRADWSPRPAAHWVASHNAAIHP
jgi:hypothetical protein